MKSSAPHDPFGALASLNDIRLPFVHRAKLKRWNVGRDELELIAAIGFAHNVGEHGDHPDRSNAGALSR
jgi:hypothetical protein